MEQKNLLRQNFITPDIGKSKAEVLASRYSKAYNITIMPIVERLRGDHALYDRIFSNASREQYPIKGNAKSALIISCVDNMEARRNILNTFSPIWSNMGIFLDGGNEDVYGQVMISNPYYLLIDNYSKELVKDVGVITGLPEMLPVTGTAQGIPIDSNFYSSTQDKPSERSCADLDQTMAINTMVATTMFSLVQTILYSRPINFNRLNISMAGTFPELLTVKNIARLAITHDEYRALDGKGLRSFLGNVYGLNIRDYSVQLIDTYNKFKREQDEKARKAKLEADAALKAAEAAKEKEVVKKPDYALEGETPVVAPPLTAIPRRRTRLAIPDGVSPNPIAM